ncbi:hypothetical protein F4820DRAFT_430866 [Hypoxylon rubiginosum]|uniref:Uncharacterized protein n=1 Tax=Hypoxylon rubiginosum TaxID=110542 RepID=A0ACB9YT16_9PEZI|nr:hypothetical protein F4820DRAFT_430866 [Hypoxylon rubiginosum]
MGKKLENVERMLVHLRAPPKARNQDDGQSDDQEWAIVPHPDANIEEEPPSRGASCHFDITLGWGKRKFTLLS